MCGFCQIDPMNKLNGTHDSMAGFLSAAATADEDRASDMPGPLAIADNPGTTASIAAGQTISETLEVAGDRDWFRIELQAGETYRITLDGQDHTGGPLGALEDPYLRLYNGSGWLVAENDDAGTGRDSRLDHTVQSSGVYFIEAAAWADLDAGDYVLTVQLDGPEPPASLQELADFLTTGFFSTPRKFNLGNTGINAKTGVLTYTLDGYAEDPDGLTADRADLVREAFKLYEAILGIDFQETSSASADLRFGDEADGAFASTVFNVSAGQGYISEATINIDADWEDGDSAPDGYTWQTILHEIGHGLGLGHQGFYNGAGIFPEDAEFANDSWHVTMMSYFTQEDNTTSGASRANLIGPMSADLLALDDLYSEYGYGTANAFVGDTVWGFNTTITPEVSVIWHDLADHASQTSFAIVDAGGTDTVDFSGYATDQRIDLGVTEAWMTEPVASNIGGLIRNMTIAPGTLIENAVSGSGNDVIVGNHADNILTGGDGDDRLEGGNGSDHLLGGPGSDILIGGAGADILDGGGGFDFVDYSAVATPLVMDLSDPSNSSAVFAEDTLIGIKGFFGSATHANTFIGDDARHFVNGGSADDVLIGGAGLDILRGRDGNDHLIGGEGMNALLGNSGDDILTGGSGFDQFTFNPPAGDADRITNFQPGIDVIAFQNDPVSFGELTIQDSPGGAMIYYGDATIQVDGVSAAILNDPAHFDFY